MKSTVSISLTIFLFTSPFHLLAQEKPPTAETTPKAESALKNASADADGLWTQDFALGQKEANEQKKDLLVNFTGSDWCHWCIKLEEEVFHKKEFQEKATANFRFVMLDFPQEKKLPEATVKQNESLQKKYQVQGFPTILLLDGEGRVYAQTGYQKGGPEAYLAHLAELRSERDARDAAFTKAKSQEGVAKAKSLLEGIEALDPEVAEVHYKAEIEEICKLDPEDTLGLKKKQTQKAALTKLQDELGALQEKGDPAAVLKHIDDFVTENKLEGAAKQEVLLLKLHVYGVEQLDKAEGLVEELIKIDATSDPGKIAARIKESIQQMKKKEGK